MIALARWLEGHGAYRDLVAWAESSGDDWEGAWRSCPRGDWLLGIAATLATTERRALVRAACECAALALEAVTDPLADEALRALAGWARGEAELDEAALAAATQRLEDALGASDDPSCQAARAAVLAALASRRDPREAPGAAAAAVQANVLATGVCGMESVLRYAHATTAERVRAALPTPVPPTSPAQQG